MKVKLDIWWMIVAVVIIFALVKQCESEPRVVTKQTIDIDKVIDSVRSATLSNVEPVYIDTSKTEIKWLKGDKKIVYKDSIIYVDKPNENTIEAKKYKTELKSNKATAKLDITSLGEVLDVQGVITYPKITKTIETVKIKDKSGLYIYAKAPITNFTNPELGALYQLRNKIFFSGGVQYNRITDKPDFNIGLGIKIF